MREIESRSVGEELSFLTNEVHCNYGISRVEQL